MRRKDDITFVASNIKVKNLELKSHHKTQFHKNVRKFLELCSGRRRRRRQIEFGKPDGQYQLNDVYCTTLYCCTFFSCFQ